VNKLFNKNILIVGAGIAGSTIARILAEHDLQVQIIDKRNHIAGNTFDFINANNERIHKYGPHLLHCNKNEKSLKFLSNFTEWVFYEHRVRALLPNGNTTSLPINKKTLEDVYGRKFKNQEEVKNFLDLIRNKRISPENTDQFFEANLGNKLADLFFRPYTKKMWGIEPKELNIAVGARLPIRTNDDDRYFNDSFQALPKEGYTKMIESMLNHKNINIELNIQFQKGMELGFDHSFLCIPIDKFFNYKFGVLPYRSIIFEERQELLEKDLETPVLNFTDASPYTRKTQWNLFPNSKRSKTNIKTVTYERPCSMEDNPNEYFYPIHTRNSKIMYEKYKKFSKNEKRITFCGRTGLFKYIDMIPAVTIHQKIAYQFLNKL
tara:strand:- start:1339 stop:2472 length:1134 start_codon:yes stop_codon:yes gene_type:complete